MSKAPAKCNYSKCIYKTKDIAPEDLYIDENTNRRYHKRCFQYKMLIDEIATYYYENVSRTVVYGALVNTIKNIVFKKRVEPEFLLYALQYTVEKGNMPKSPFFLHYLVDDGRIKKAYQSTHPSKKIQIDLDNISVAEEQQFEYKPKERQSFGDVIKKKKKQGG